MRVTILGAGTAVPAAGRSPAGIHVDVGGEHVLLDAGAGTLQRLQQAGVPFAELDRIFLTHFHVDHCLDLVSILFALRIPSVNRRKTLFVYGPPGLKRLYRRLNTAFSGWLSPRGFPLILKEVRQGMIRLPGYTVEARGMNHYQTGAVGYRITAAGKVMAYSGDTDTCGGIVELGRSAHLLILECSVTDEGKVAGHLTPSECGGIASAAGCRHLLLTHFYPVFRGYDIRARVRANFRGRVTLAKDFTSIRI